MLRATGRNVEVQNYIDNTGVQVADVVVAFEHLEKKSPADVQSADRNHAIRLSVLGSLRADVRATTRTIRRHSNGARRRLHAIESGEGATAELAHLVSDAIVRAHLATMYRLNIEYDVLPRESEILHLKFWATGVRAAEGAQGDLFRDRRQEQGLLGDAGVGLPRKLGR